MTRNRILKCDNPLCPHELQKSFNDWVREKLPSSFEGFRAYDLDWIFWIKAFGKVNKVMLVEIKTHGRHSSIDQLRTYNFLDKCIRNNLYKDYQYLGFHEIVFENTFFTDGRVYFDGLISSEQEIINILSFKKIFNVSNN